MEIQLLSSADQHASHFKTFVKCLVEKFQPLYLFSFAKTKTILETTSCFKEQQNSYHCDYSLLMVTGSITRIEHEVQDFSNFHYKHGFISIISHGQETILEAIKSNSRFFMNVYEKGQLLFSHDGLTHFEFNGRFIPTQAAKKAQLHFNNRMPVAEGFLHGAGECLAKGDFKVSAFMLHQVVEQCCSLLLRVHIAYRSELHNLLRMLRLCRAFSDRPLKTILSGSAEDERLFNLLLRSYSGTRYVSGFFVSESDAKNIYERVAYFVTVVKEMCTEKIGALENEACLYKELRGESEVKVD